MTGGASTPQVRLASGAATQEQLPKSSLLVSVQALLTILVVALFILTFSVQPFRIPSSSMVPTLLVGDFVLVRKQTATSEHLPLAPGVIHRGDIIVFHFPPQPRMDLVKRVIGLPGDHIRLHASHVFVNGTVLQDEHALYRGSRPDTYRDNFPDLDSTEPEIDARWWTELRRLVVNGELVVPPGQYFVLGDNRNESDDSRYWGLVPAGNILGEPLSVYFSLNAATANEVGAMSGVPSSGLFGRVTHLARWKRMFHTVR